MQGDTLGILISLFSINLIIVLISVWFVFKKANKPGWGALIPIYNIYLFVKISGRPGWWTVSYILWGIIPVLQIFGITGLLIASSISLAQRFNKGTLFGLGLVFFSFIFWPILAFGNARYSDISPVDTPQEKKIPVKATPEPSQHAMNYPSIQPPAYDRVPKKPLPQEQKLSQYYSSQQTFQQPPVFKRPSVERPFERRPFDSPKMDIPVPQKPVSKQPFTKKTVSKQPKMEQTSISRPQIERPSIRIIRERPLIQRPIIERPLMEEPVKKREKNQHWQKGQKPGNSSEKKSKWDRLL